MSEEEEEGDPLIFDLNGDNKIELTGEAGVSNGISLPSGLWRLTVKSTAEQTRFTVADTNQGQGTYNGAAFAQVDINATGGWKIGTELVTGSAEDGDWAEQKPVLTQLSEELYSIELNGLRLEAELLSKMGYDDEQSIVNVGGEKVLFDLDPNDSSWEKHSTSFRPGLGAPALPGGRAVYQNGRSDSIGQDGVWTEDTGAGPRADLYDANDERAGEWLNGEKPIYYYGTRVDEEQIQWIKGNGDALLVWDHNENGIIDDATELMSEFDTKGGKAFANGFEKLAHYFDHDDDGIIEASEMGGLRFWVDDGDAITEAGELKRLPEYGITEIVLPTFTEDFDSTLHQNRDRDRAAKQRHGAPIELPDRPRD